MNPIYRNIAVAGITLSAALLVAGAAGAFEEPKPAVTAATLADRTTDAAATAERLAIAHVEPRGAPAPVD